MTARVFLQCDDCGEELQTNANASGTNPAQAARAVARQWKQWTYAGSNIRRDRCRECSLVYGFTEEDLERIASR